MRKGKFEQKGRRRRRIFCSKALTLVMALVLLVGGVVGGTVAWLTADGGSVTNTFTESDIDITLSEEKPENKTAPMVPGWTIDKDPKVIVDADSEDCWLFVKITESTTPDLDAYISYAINLYDEDTNPNGWQIIQEENEDREIVIGRKVYKGEGAGGFNILGEGEYNDLMGTPNDESDDFKIEWDTNEVCVKPSVTKEMMTEISTVKPTLSFQAYAVQLFKTNSDGNKETTADEFTAAEAWKRAASMSSGN